MTHAHAPSPSAGRERRLAATLALVAGFLVVEAVAGWLANSLALLADAAHMLGDAAALGVALFAARMAGRPATSRHTYGLHRAEVLAALANAAALLAISAYVVASAVARLRSPSPVDGLTTLAVGAGGLLVNVVSLRILSPRAEAGLNERSARLHVWSDLLGSVQVIAAGAGILALGWSWLDPVASIAVSLLVLRSAVVLVRECAAVLLEGAPAHIDVDGVRAAMLAVPGVVDVHDLHVWTITSGFVALSAHARAEGRSDRRSVLRALRTRLQDGFGIEHVTIELDDTPCEDPHEGA
jgi:cobalt-zinc-cadmium efflux system protein